ACAGSRPVEPRAELDVQVRLRTEGLAQNRPGVSMKTLSALLLAAACLSAGTLYLGGRPNKIFIIDEATEKGTGEILCKTGTPLGMVLSQDRKHFYVENIAYEDLEIVDIASRQVIDNFRLSEGNKKMRIFGFETDPQERYMILFVKTATKQADRFEISSPTLLQYDLKTHKVTR